MQLTGTSIAFLYGFPFRLPSGNCFKEQSKIQPRFVELPKPEEVTGNHVYDDDILTASWEFDQLKKIELGGGKVKRYMLQ